MLLLPVHSHVLCLNESCSNFLCSPSCALQLPSYHYTCLMNKPHIFTVLSRSQDTADRLERKRGGTLFISSLGQRVVVPNHISFLAKLGVLCGSTSSGATKYPFLLSTSPEKSGWLCCFCPRRNGGVRAVVLLGQGLGGGGTLTPPALSLQRKAPGDGP